MSVEDAINYSPNEEEDYYALLSCDESSTVEQITAEYKVLALQYHPDKNDGDKEAEKKFQLLKYAKEVLCDPEKRCNYDKWRNSGIKISYKQWLGMKEHVQQTMHWSTPKTKDRMLPDTSGEAGGSPSHLRGHPTNAHRRASEGGATNLYYRSGHGVPFNCQEPSEIVSKFRNYEI
ncbi:J domain-containing protein [Harpegnathos saltator]|uniref:J domain-containing protein n=1 Tax=Harpegnathos saltator TaxID=610380 RepID=E2BFX9_HARSA|nr:J domain-containing protein [Harpegnathos saltator]XP_025155726.1 J domain-containing protein [Harpegnathos saltator]EFN85381.1 J domain-containing protein [Harpegnathos saltator]